MNKDKIIKPLLLIAAIILFCSVFVRLFSGSETLAEYAAKHPGAAQPPQAGSSASDTDGPAGNNKTQDTQGGKAAPQNPAIPETAGNPEGMPSPPSGTIPPEQGQNNGHTILQGAGQEPETESLLAGNGAQNGKAPTDAATASEPGGKAPANAATVSEPGGKTNQAASDINTGTYGTKGASTAPSNPEEEKKRGNDMEANPNRTTYQNGFYYEPLSDEIIKRITGISYPVTEAEKDNPAAEAVNIVKSAGDIQISYDDLCYMSVLHYNFHGVERTGELICNKAIAQDLVEIFYELYQNEYQIEQIRLIDEYSGDDTLSMQDNNTSCFNYRVVDGTSSLSKHAMGLAIDINPFFNPYVVFRPDGATYISPQGSETYADRSKNFAYKIDENDLCYRLFKEHGFTWGGHWNSCKDYQHFQKVPG